MTSMHSVTISFEEYEYAQDFIDEIREKVHISAYKPNRITVTIDEQEVS